MVRDRRVGFHPRKVAVADVGVLETPFDNIPLCEVGPLDTRTYTTRNTTALHEAIGLTIESFERRIAALPLVSRPVQVIFAIFTDGLEIASSRYTWKDLAAKLKERQEKEGWQFLFLAATRTPSPRPRR